QGFCTIDVAFEHDRPTDYRFLEVSPSFEMQTGIVNGAGRWMREIAPDQDEYWFEVYGHVALAREPSRFEYFSTPLGRWWSVYAFPVDDPALRRIGVLFNDITERKRAEEAIREREEHFRTLTSLVPALLWQADPSGREISLNQHWLEYTGQTLEETQDGGWLAVIHPDDRETTRRVFAEAHAMQRPLEIEPRVRRHDGVYRWFLIRQLPLHDAEGRIVRWFGAATDIHDLRITQERLQSAFALQTLGVMYWDSDFGLTEVNDAFLQMTGFRREEALGKIWQELTPPEFHEVSRRAVEEVMTRGEATPYEKQYYRKDGSRWWGIFAARQVGDEVLEFVIDVSGRKQAEEALRESEERHRLIVERALDYAILTTDSDGRIESWSPGAEAVFGWTADEAIGQAVAITFTPEDRANDAPEKERAAAREMGSAPDRRWHERKDGARVFIDGVVRALDDGYGGVRGFLKLGQDVTERRRTEASLRESEERFRQFADASTDALWIRDAETLQFEFVSPVFEQLYGVDLEQVLQGDNLASWAILLHPEDRARILAGIERVRAGEQVTHEFRILRSSDGELRWLRDTDFPLVDERGQVRRIGGITEDITKRKQIEDALRESEERFRAVADLVPDLLWSNDATGHTDWFNQRWIEYTGQTLEETSGYGWLDAIHPDDGAASMASFQAAIAQGHPLHHEHRIRGVDGSYRWFVSRAEPVRDESGEIVRWFGTNTDMHVQRIARDELRLRVEAATGELRALSQQLLQVQEMERRHLARELHDEIGQLLTGLSFTLAMARRESASEHVERAAEISRDILEQVRQLSID
ncbi:MAG: PAS domain S-box protein, partial [Chloroflexota bacterium]|nr:PAS domain S-box protein [Chloroflexota bacterium]